MAKIDKVKQHLKSLVALYVVLLNSEEMTETGIRKCQNHIKINRKELSKLNYTKSEIDEAVFITLQEVFYNL